MIERLLEVRIKNILEVDGISTEDLIKCYVTVWAEKEKIALPEDLKNQEFLTNPNATILLELDPKSFFLALSKSFLDVASSYVILSSLEKNYKCSTLASLTVVAVRKSLSSETLWGSESECRKGYEDYKKTMDEYGYSSCLITLDDYKKLRSSMSQLKVDEEVMNVTGIVPGRESENARKAAFIMKNDLKLSYESQYKFLQLVYSENPKRKDYIKEL